jgi:IS5 family transposase
MACPMMGVCECWVTTRSSISSPARAFPHERSDLSHGHKRLGDKMELLLVESVRVLHETGALRSQDLKRVAVDITVQPRAITFPTELLHAAINGLVRLTRSTAPSRLHLKPEA